MSQMESGSYSNNKYDHTSIKLNCTLNYTHTHTHTHTTRNYCKCYLHIHVLVYIITQLNVLNYG